MRNGLPTISLFVARVESPIGTILTVHDCAGRLRALDFHDYETRMHRLLKVHYGEEGRGYVLTAMPAPPATREGLARYFAGEHRALDSIQVATAGTAFQLEVWTALRTILAGTVLSYAALAQQIARPKAVRAVGLANGSNPIGVVIPCHRVVGSDMSLTGYAGGLQRKRWLLAHEGNACGVTDASSRVPGQSQMQRIRSP